MFLCSVDSTHYCQKSPFLKYGLPEDRRAEARAVSSLLISELRLYFYTVLPVCNTTYLTLQLMFLLSDQRLEI